MGTIRWKKHHWGKMEINEDATVAFVDNICASDVSNSLKKRNEAERRG